MKIIDLLNKIANGEVDEEIKYLFSKNDFCTIKEFFNRYIVDKENLNLELEDKDIPLIPVDELIKINEFKERPLGRYKAIDYNFKVLKEKINQIIEEINNEYNK